MKTAMSLHQHKPKRRDIAGKKIHPEDYKYSSAKFYEIELAGFYLANRKSLITDKTGIDDFGFLSHYRG